MRFRPPLRALSALLVFARVVSAQTVPAAAGPVQPAALTALNDAFRAAYAEAKTRILASPGPTLIVSGDTFTLLRNGNRVQANVGTVPYDPLKTIAHIPLAIYVTLTPVADTVSGDRLKILDELRNLIPPAETSLDTVKLSS